MISGGNATVYVADMDAAVQFYTATLGLALTNRFGNHWATLEAGPCYWSEKGAGLTIGLHPLSPAHPAPGTSGGVGYGLATYVNEFPPDMVPLTDLAGEDHTAKASPTSSRLGGHAIV